MQNDISQSKKKRRSKYPIYCTCCEKPELLETPKDAYKHKNLIMKRKLIAQQQEEKNKISQSSQSYHPSPSLADTKFEKYHYMVRMGLTEEQIKKKMSSDIDLKKNAATLHEEYNRKKQQLNEIASHRKQELDNRAHDFDYSDQHRELLNSYAEKYKQPFDNVGEKEDMIEFDMSFLTYLLDRLQFYKDFKCSRNTTLNILHNTLQTILDDNAFDNIDLEALVDNLDNINGSSSDTVINNNSSSSSSTSSTTSTSNWFVFG